MTAAENIFNIFDIFHSSTIFHNYGFFLNILKNISRNFGLKKFTKTLDVLTMFSFANATQLSDIFTLAWGSKKTGYHSVLTKSAPAIMLRETQANSITSQVVQ